MAIEIPHPCTALDHEVELGVVIGKKGRDIPQHAAMDHISGTPFTLALSTRSNPSIICLHVCVGIKPVGEPNPTYSHAWPPRMIMS
jgi:hypothetical protein